MSYHSRQPSIASSLISSSNHSHPQKIGPWKLGKTLGRGATGRVLLGTHTQTGQKAAVKVVSKSELNEDYEPSPNEGLPYGIEREIIIMKLLAHPNVLRLYDVWETSKALYLVLEYVEGGELFDLLVERGPLQEIEAIKYFRQIILGTAYCHALGICHRDLKPENLLLDANLNVKLADFGMAALESNGKLLETSCGSPHYAAPEIVSGLKYHGAASDIWSCGVILFALLTGRLPFDDENIRNLLLKVQAGNFEMPDEISYEAQDLLAKMLTVDPMDRIQTGKILSHPLLNKYPIPNEDLISVKSLPHPETAYKSLGSVKNIDKTILQNLTILWHDRNQQDIINCLLRTGSNPEKTFYALLLRYRHNQEDLIAANASPSKKQQSSGMVHSTSSASVKLSNTPRKKRASHMSASSSRNRPVSFQYKNGVRTSISNNPGRLSTASSVNNSPFKSPSRRSPARFSYAQSPVRKSPYRNSPYRNSLAYRSSNSPFKSPTKSSHSRFDDHGDSQQPPPVPRNIYNEIVNAQKNGSLGSMPPTLPSKDTIYNDDKSTTNAKSMKKSPNPIVDEISASHQDAFNALASAPHLSPRKSIVAGRNSPIRSPAKSAKRTSLMATAQANNRLSRRKSVQQSMSTGLKRNSITIKLLSTYAKLSGETDWEYMDKQTRRTSATFASLCDKIFNQEDYDEDEEKLVDEEEKQAREYEKLMEIERKKHEAELRARRELAKQKKRQKRKSLLSSKKLAIVIKNDTENSEQESDVPNAEDAAAARKAAEDSICQPKRGSKAANGKARAVSDGGVVIDHLNDELTADDVENIKRRSVTQPESRRKNTPILTRRPVSRLDPLWMAYENEELTRAQNALESELKESSKSKSKSKAKGKKKINRESMVSVMDDRDDIKGKTRRYSRNSDFDREMDYELPRHEKDDSDLSEEYMSEIRKSRLLNSQKNINGMAKGDKVSKQAKKRASIQRANDQLAREKQRELESRRIKTRERDMKSTRESRDVVNDKRKEEQRKTLIGDVKIPTVTRKSKYFTDSNKRLSVLTMRSTKESYRDLNSILDGSEDEEEVDSKGMPTLRTSFADRLDKAGLAADDDDEDAPIDEGSIMDFDEHLANKRSSYYAGKGRRTSHYGTGVNKRMSQRPVSELPELPDDDESNADDTDDTFATKNSRSKSKYSLLDDHKTDNTDVFDTIKLPNEKHKAAKSKDTATRKSHVKSMQPSAASMLLPDLKNMPATTDKTSHQTSKGKSHTSKYYQGQNSDSDNTLSSAVPPTPPNHLNQTKKPLEDSTNRLGNNQPDIAVPKKRNRSIFRKLSWGSKKALEDQSGTQTNTNTNVSNGKLNPNANDRDPKNSQLPSPAESSVESVEEKKGGGFFRWLSGGSTHHQETITPSEIKRFNTILPKQEMDTALFALLNSWTNFGLRNLKNDTIGYNITGSISKDNAFDLKSCKFRIKVNPREFNQKSEIVCARVKGSKTTTDTLFKEIEKVLRKEGVMDRS